MADSKRVLMLLSNPFRPDPRVHREALSLVKAGYSVTIICWDREGSSNAAENIDGINLVRIGPRAVYGKSGGFVKALPKFWKNLRASAAALEFDAIHAHDLDTLSPGLKLASKRNIPLIYDSHEIYHEMAAENLSAFWVRLLARYERRMVRKPRIMITVNAPIADIFRGYGAKDVRVVMNCQPDAQVDAASVAALRKSLSPEGKPITLYIGVLEPNRLLLETAKAHSARKDDMVLVIGGFGSLEAQLRGIAESSRGRVKLVGRVRPSEVPVYNRAADVLLATYDPLLRNNRMGAPNKLFESMAASRPIVVSEGTYAADVVRETDCGLAVRYDGQAAISAAAGLATDMALASRLGEAGRRAYEEKYNWQVMEKRLLEAYSDLLAQ